MPGFRSSLRSGPHLGCAGIARLRTRHSRDPITSTGRDDRQGEATMGFPFSAEDHDAIVAFAQIVATEVVTQLGAMTNPRVCVVDES